MAESRSMTAEFPALASLNLGSGHLLALARQGNLHAERLRSGKEYYKLRFRVGSKQHARYVGNNTSS